MRTTLDRPDELLRQAKIAAVQRNSTLRDLGANALRREPAAADVPLARPALPAIQLPAGAPVLRLSSQPRVMGDAALTPERALHAWDGLAQATGLQEITATPPADAQDLRTLVSGRAPGPKLCTDAWLAALALSLDSEMVSFDRGFRSFPGLRLTLLRA